MSGEDSLSEGLIGFFSYIVVEFWACISGVDSYVRNVDAAGSNPAKSTGFFVFFSYAKSSGKRIREFPRIRDKLLS